MGFGDVEKRQLAAICDTIFGTLGPEDAAWVQAENPGKVELEAFCNRSASSYGVPEAVEEYVLKHAPQEGIAEFSLLLRAFGSPPLMMLLNGRWSAFDALSPEEREATLKDFKGSWLEAKRKAFCALKSVICLKAFTILRGGSPKSNPNWASLGYEGPEVSPASITDEFVFTMVNSSLQQDCSLEYDVVVVGSGCGGSVVAAELSGIGAKVLVVEKSTYFTRAEMSGTEGEGFDRYYERGAILSTEDSGIGVLAGSAFGGGSAINWACCLDTPWYVRKEWATVHNLKSFASASFQRSIDAVKERLGVTSTGVAHNGCNKLLLAGCDKLGHSIKTTGQNMVMVGEDSPGSAFISAGDRHGIKQSAPQTFLKDAAECGCHFADQTYVTKVLYSKGRATGVATEMVGMGGKKLKVNISAKTVVVSCGSVHTPALLMRSQIPSLNQSGCLGKNLRLHPVCTTVAMMPKTSKLVEIWKGAPMTTVCDSVAAGPAGDFYGAKLECPSTHPGMFSVGIPWHGRKEFKDLMLNAARCHITIVLCRDKGSGEVRLVNGEPRLYYPLSSHDSQSILDGLVESIRISAAFGAKAIGTAQSVVKDNPRHLPPIDQPEARNNAVEQFIRDVREAGLTSDFRTSIFSAHQMGSCKMSASPKLGVVQETGEAWALKGLFVADTSIFPTPSGANPMITTYACAHSIAQHIKAIHVPRTKL